MACPFPVAPQQAQPRGSGDTQANATTAAGEGAAPLLLPPRFHTVGRLDVNTSGLLLVTNDGKWSNAVIHPSSNLTKVRGVNLMSGWKMKTKIQDKTITQTIIRQSH